MNRWFIWWCVVVVLSCILAKSSAKVPQSGDAKNLLEVENNKSFIKTEPKTNSEVSVHMSEDGYTIMTIPKTTEKHNLIHSLMTMFRNATKVEHQALLVIAPEGEGNADKMDQNAVRVIAPEDKGNAGKMDQKAVLVIAAEDEGNADKLDQEDVLVIAPEDEGNADKMGQKAVLVIVPGYEGNAIKADQTTNEYDVAKSSSGHSQLSYNDTAKNVTEDHNTAESGRVEITSSVDNNVLVLNEDSPKDQGMLTILDNSVPFMPSAASESSNSNLQRTNIGSNDSPSSPIPELSKSTSVSGLEVSEASALASSIESSSSPVNREPTPNGPIVLSATSEISNRNTERTDLSSIPYLSKTTSELGLDVSENPVLSSSIAPSSTLQNRDPAPNVPVVSSAASQNSNIKIQRTDIRSNDSSTTSIPEVPKKVSLLVSKISEARAPSSSIDPSSTPQNRELNVETTTSTTTTETSSTKPSDINSDVTTSRPIKEDDDVPSTSVSPNSRDSLAKDLSLISNSMEGPLNFKATNGILKDEKPLLESCRKSQTELIDIFNMGLEQLTSLLSTMYKKMSLVTSPVTE